jgi:hypothetical protein
MNYLNNLNTVNSLTVCISKLNIQRKEYSMSKMYVVFTVLFLAAVLTFTTVPTYAISVVVDSVTGVSGTSTTDTIVDAIAQVNAGVDGSNTITLTTTGIHILPASTVSQLSSGGPKSVDFVASAPIPIIRLSGGSGQSWTINQDTTHTTSVTFTGIAIIPADGNIYDAASDGMRCFNGSIVFTDCLLTVNDVSTTSNGIGSYDGGQYFSINSSKVADDWIRSDNADLIFHNTLITGCYDDAILAGAAGRAGGITVRLDQGSAIANVGGAGIQVYGANVNVELDGSGANNRVQIANVGQRPGTDDTGIKFFWDVGCSLDINEADIVNCPNSAIYDFEGVPSISITNSRIAIGNSKDAVPAGLITIDDVSDDSNYTTNFVIDHSTFHDGQGVTNTTANLYFINDSVNDPVIDLTITNSIFSGAGDTFILQTTLVSLTNVAVVTVGSHAVQSPGDLGAGSLNSDPDYIQPKMATPKGEKSGHYALGIGRSKTNANFLKPNSIAYRTGDTGGGELGGAPQGTVVTVNDAGGADFTSIQAAINAWAAGGSLSGATAPYIIDIVAGSGPYDELIVLNDSSTGAGDIVGDIVIRSDTPGTTIPISLQKTAVNAGLDIFQRSAEVDLIDLQLSPSTTVPPTTHLVRMDENGPNNFFNWVRIYDSVLTDIDTTGTPIITSKASALALAGSPFIPSGSPWGAASWILTNFGDAGESRNLLVQDCAFYGPKQGGIRSWSAGQNGEQAVVRDCILVHCGSGISEIAVTQFGGTIPYGYVLVEGTGDPADGPAGVTAVFNSSWHAYYFSASNQPVDFTLQNVIAVETTDPNTRPVSGSGTNNVNITNAIFRTIGPIVQGPPRACTWRGITLGGNAGYFGVGGAGSLSVIDSIITGSFTGTPPSLTTITNSGMVMVDIPVMDLQLVHPSLSTSKGLIHYSHKSRMQQPLIILMLNPTSTPE